MNEQKIEFEKYRDNIFKMMKDDPDFAEFQIRQLWDDNISLIEIAEAAKHVVKMFRESHSADRDNAIIDLETILADTQAPDCNRSS